MPIEPMMLKVPKSYIVYALLIVLAGTAFWLGGKIRNEQSPKKETPRVAAPAPTSKPVGESASSKKVREIEVTARQFEFSPNPITVALGETVRLKLKSIDVTHGFAIPEFGIDEVLDPGETVTVEFQATKKGEFPFLCSVACGIGHGDMRGRIVVE